VTEPPPRYRIEFTQAALRDLKGLPKDALQRINAAMLLLAENPRPPKAQRLQGNLRDYHRVRVGNYRIIYRIEDDRLVVCVVKIGDRKDVYRSR
jgi:mRNA interferase RelE/StbE